MKQFDYCVSNPPYQDSKNRPIFQHFQNFANYCSETSSMIYMASRWWYGTTILEEFRQEMLCNKRLKSVDYYNFLETKRKIFDGLDIAGGVSIVNFSKNENDYFTLRENLTNHNIEMEHESKLIYPIQASLLALARKIYQKIVENNIPVVKQRNEIRISELELTGKEVSLLSPEKYNENISLLTENRIKYYANISGLKTGKSDFYVIDKVDKYVPNNRYKVCIGQSIIENDARPLRVFVFDKETTFGRSAASIAYFDTLEESENFAKYASTKFFEFCFRVTLLSRLRHLCAAVPDFVDYKNYETINWNGNIDEQLYKIFELTEDEINVVETMRGAVRS